MSAAPLSGAAALGDGGLDRMVALRSSVCRLGAEDGRLSYRGFDVRELAEHSTYEETAFVLVHGDLPSGAELRFFSRDLRAKQKLPPAVLKALKAAPPSTDAMAVLRTALSTAGYDDVVPLPPSGEGALHQGLRLIALTPTVVAALYRLSRGQRPVTPRKSLGFAANFLYMLRGETPDRDSAHAFDVGLILRADNELNPSTFAARVAAATGTDLYGAVAAAVATLAGPRHGGHARAVIQLLDELGSTGNVARAVQTRLEQDQKIPGFGHAVYRGEDPRTAQLRSLAETQCARAGLPGLFRTARELEAVVLRDAGQYPIVDFYLAPLYRALGIPVELFTPVFALSRMSGWVAHVLEQYRDVRLIRPRAEYVGPLPRAYVPIRKRR